MDFIHPVLRPHQEKTLERIRQSQARIIVLQAPTGAGKSFFPAQLAAWGHKILALVKTKSLQAQYVKSYGFTELYGKGNYECLELGQKQEDFLQLVDGSNDIAYADLCVCPKEYKAECELCCPYPLARSEFIDAKAGTLNYMKFLTDRPVVEDFNPEYLFLDEAHELSDLTVDFSGIVLNWKSKRLMEYCEAIHIDLPQPLAIEAGAEFLRGLLQSLGDNKPLHPSSGGDKKLYKWHSRMMEKVDITLSAMRLEPDCWYVESDEKEFLAKPLSARFHFLSLFDKAKQLVLMSATIGMIEYFSRELGLKDFEFINVPNDVWTPEQRPIEDLGGPKLNWKSSASDWNAHTEIIASRINQCPNDWTGLIHVPSKWLANQLAYGNKYKGVDGLYKHIKRDIFIPKEEWGTEQAAEEWMKVEDNGTICISWNFWEGLDAGKDRINIVAKVPFVPMIFDKEKRPKGFDTNRFMFDGKSGYSRIANKLVQGLGRIRRGNKEDYGPNKIVAICDSNWKRLRNFIDRSILESVK